MIGESFFFFFNRWFYSVFFLVFGLTKCPFRGYLDYLFWFSSGRQIQVLVGGGGYEGKIGIM